MAKATGRLLKFMDTQSPARVRAMVGVGTGVGMHRPYPETSILYPRRHESCAFLLLIHYFPNLDMSWPRLVKAGASRTRCASNEQTNENYLLRRLVVSKV